MEKPRDNEQLTFEIDNPVVSSLISDYPNAAFQPFSHQHINSVTGKIKYRTLHAPSQEMRQAHDLLIPLLQQLDAVSEYATGSVAGSSPVKNVERHIGNRYFYLLDLKDAYQSIPVPWLADTLSNLGFPATKTATLDILQKYCQYPGQDGLCLGAPASPTLFNLAFSGADRDTGLMCEHYGITFTRYLDDFTFSSKEPIGDKKRHNLRKLLRAEINMPINHQKCHVYDLQVAPVTITGIQINRSGYWQLTTSYQKGLIDKLKDFKYQLSSGESLSEYQIAQVGGYYGTVIAAHDKRRSTPTEFELEFAHLYANIKGLEDTFSYTS